MTDHNKQREATLSRIQARALPILLSASSIAQGCRRAGISRDRFYDWMKNDDVFHDAYEIQSRELMKTALGSLRLLGQQAVEVMGRLLRARSERVRLKAACSIIDSLTKFYELQEIESRLSELEHNLEANRR